VRIPLEACLVEVSKGVGPTWTQYRLLGATRAGLAGGKEAIGKAPERYKLVRPGAIFYNPMRILLGSIAFLEEGAAPGITSPDYVVFETRKGVLHPRFFYHWLRSIEGDAFIRSLARGAVRERLLFRRLVSASLDLPRWEIQEKAANQLAVVERARAAAEAKVEAAARLPWAYLHEAFVQPSQGPSALPRAGWKSVSVGEVADLLPSKSVSTDGDVVVQVITTACLTESGFDPTGVKPARMWAKDAAEATVSTGEILVARSNTSDLNSWSHRTRACVGWEGGRFRPDDPAARPSWRLARSSSAASIGSLCFGLLEGTVRRS